MAPALAVGAGRPEQLCFASICQQESFVEAKMLPTTRVSSAPRTSWRNSIAAGAKIAEDP
jgi:hypothetical protein